MSCVVLRMHRMGPEPSALSRSAAARRRTSGLTPAAPPSSMSSSTKFAEGSSCLSARTCCFDIDRAPKRPQPPQQRPCCTPSRRKKALCLQVAGAFALRLLRRGRGRQARTGRWRHGGAPPQQPRRAKPTGAVQTRGRRGTGRFGGAQSGTRSTVIHPFYSVVHPAALAPASPPLAVSPGARDKCSDGLQQRGTLNIPATDGQHPTRKNEGLRTFFFLFLIVRAAQSTARAEAWGYPHPPLPGSALSRHDTRPCGAVRPCGRAAGRAPRGAFSEANRKGARERRRRAQGIAATVLLSRRVRQWLGVCAVARPGRRARRLGGGSGSREHSHNKYLARPRARRARRARAPRGVRAACGPSQWPQMRKGPRQRSCCAGGTSTPCWTYKKGLMQARQS